MSPTSAQHPAPTSRNDTLDAAKRIAGRGLVDVMVIGGGIVGTGVARDAAMRGLRVLLAEQGDLASGTSSRSSRLLHGGLRYLAQGRIGLVRQAQREKKTLRRIAPHLYQPLPFLFPATPHGPWRLWKLRLGVWLYSRLGEGDADGSIGRVESDELRRLLPALDASRFRGAVRYFDAMTSDARLVIDTARSAAAHGALICNYTRVSGVERRGGRWHAELEDVPGGSRFEVVARAMVNAAGPWADRLEPAACKLRLTKGVHLVLDRARLPLPQALVLPRGSRIIFLLPWGRRTILGTTDTDYAGDPGDPRCDADDVRYLLGAVNEAFPTLALTPADVMATWAGLRPLVGSGRGRPSEISRHHHIQSPHPGWLDVTGGKLTTYRLMAQEAADHLGESLGQPLPASRTAVEPIVPESDRAYSSVLPPPIDEACVRHACVHEWAHHLDDVMIRRTGWAYAHPEIRSLPSEVGAWMGQVLAWDPGHQCSEIAAFTSESSE